MPGPALTPVLWGWSLGMQQGDDAPLTRRLLALEKIHLKANNMWGFVRESSSPTPAPTNTCTCCQGRDPSLCHSQGEILAQDFGDTATLTRQGRRFLTFMLTRRSLRWWLPNHPELVHLSPGGNFCFCAATHQQTAQPCCRQCGWRYLGSDEMTTWKVCCDWKWVGWEITFSGACRNPLSVCRSGETMTPIAVSAIHQAEMWSQTERLFAGV